MKNSTPRRPTTTKIESRLSKDMSRQIDALAIAVTLVGWMGLLKGVALLTVPPSAMASAYKSAGFERYFYAWMGAALALGHWMTVDAFGS